MKDIVVDYLENKKLEQVQIYTMGVQKFVRSYNAQRELYIRREEKRCGAAALVVQKYFRRCTAQEKAQVLREEKAHKIHCATILQVGREGSVLNFKGRGSLMACKHDDEQNESSNENAP